MNKKSIFSAMLVCLLALSLVFAACSGKKDGGGSGGGTVKASSVGKAAPASDFNYDMSEDGKGIVIRKYTGKGGKLVIPAEIEGLPVVEFKSDNNFYGVFGGEIIDYNGNSQGPGPGAKITSVVIPASIKVVQGYSFSRNPSLTSVTFLGSNVELGSGVFSNCINLAELKFPDGENVLKPNQDVLAEYAFQFCTKLPLAVRSKLKDWGFNI
ncbi:hypothetical protein FACS189485_03300 [Spirochaetia bacterium]|nr:hypothetical protein FACS189485_03300 [Spirochaetia bacterium]